MDSFSNTVAGTARMANPVDPLPLPARDWRHARPAHVNLLLTGLPRVNVLLVGINGGVWNHLETLLPDLDEPITTWSPGQQLLLPPITRNGTIILHDVGALPYGDQLRLVTWLEQTAGRTQVVSTTATPLMPRVEAGTFDDTLYYRLNTVCVDLTS